MKRLGLVLLVLLVTSASAQNLRMNSILTVDEGVIYDINPTDCYITGDVQYMFVPDYGMTLTIENIICSDKIFANGFEN